MNLVERTRPGIHSDRRIHRNRRTNKLSSKQPGLCPGKVVGRLLSPFVKAFGLLMRRSSYTILSYLFQSRLIKIPLPNSGDARDKHKDM